MSEARRILEERLARGEITEAEYDRLLAKLSAAREAENKPASTPPPPPASAPAVQADKPAKPRESKAEKVVGSLIFGAIVLFIIAYFRMQNDFDETRALCSTKGYSTATCNCFIAGVQEHYDITFYLPIFGRLFALSDAEQQAIATAVLRDCL